MFLSIKNLRSGKNCCNFATANGKQADDAWETGSERTLTTMPQDKTGRMATSSGPYRQRQGDTEHKRSLRQSKVEPGNQERPEGRDKQGGQRCPADKAVKIGNYILTAESLILAQDER